jgi:hypothetical protein
MTKVAAASTAPKNGTTRNIAGLPPTSDAAAMNKASPGGQIGIAACGSADEVTNPAGSSVSMTTGHGAVRESG